MRALTAQLVLAILLVLVFLVMVLTGHNDDAQPILGWIGLILSVILGGALGASVNTEQKNGANRIKTDADIPRYGRDPNGD